MPSSISNNSNPVSASVFFNDPTGTTRLPTLCLAVFVMILWTGLAWATPNVNNNTISWPDNGWYQVQRASDFQSICEGGTSCVVEPGEYIVINHTLAERFENIVVTTQDNNTGGIGNNLDSVSVSGNTISWPDDGWYQVQSATDFSSLCEGGRSCTVSPGTYVVINHSTGVRFEDIVVGSSTEPTSSQPTNGDTNNNQNSFSRINVTANTISWPDDGWYQVQSLGDFVSICEGGRECTVGDGEYVVINHRTGVRTEVSVGSTTGTGNPAPTTPPTPPVTSTGPGFGSSSGGPLPFVNTNVSVPGPGYNALTENQKAQLPDDCLIDGSKRLISLVFCYSVQDRSLISLFADGSPHFSFQLPGDNATNRIEGLHSVSFDRFAIVANTTSNPAEPQHEVNFFNASGAFCCTFPLFNNIQDIAGNPRSTTLAVNIQGEPLLSRGVVETNVSQGTRNSRLYVAGNYYETIRGGDPSQVNDWRHQGVVIQRIDVDNGNRVAVQLIPGAFLATLPFDTINLSSFTPIYNNNDGLDLNDLHNNIPDAASIMRGDYAIALRETTFDTAPADLLTPERSTCELPDSFGQSVSCTVDPGPIERACSSRGTVIDTSMVENNFVPGTGSFTRRSRTLEFADCQHGAYTYNGQIQNESFLGSVRRGFMDSVTTTFTNFELTEPSSPFNQNFSLNSATQFFSTINGVVTEVDQSGDFSGLRSERTIEVTNYQQNLRGPNRTGGSFDNELKRVSNHSYTRNQTESQFNPGVTETGSLQLVRLNSVTQFLNTTLTDQYPRQAFGVSGSFNITENRGGSLNITAPLSVPDNEAEAWRVQFNGADGSRADYRIPGEGLFVPWQVAP